MNDHLTDFYRKLVSDLRTADIEDHYLFCKLFREVVFLCGLKREDVCHQFGISFPIFEFYIDRINSPHPLLRKPVYEWLADQVEKEMKE